MREPINIVRLCEFFNHPEKQFPEMILYRHQSEIEIRTGGVSSGDIPHYNSAKIISDLIDCCAAEFFHKAHFVWHCNATNSFW